MKTIGFENYLKLFNGGNFLQKYGIHFRYRKLNTMDYGHPERAFFSKIFNFCGWAYIFVKFLEIKTKTSDKDSFAQSFSYFSSELQPHHLEASL